MAGAVTADPLIPGLSSVSPPEMNSTSGYDRFRLSWARALQDPTFVTYVRSRVASDLFEFRRAVCRGPRHLSPFSLRRGNELWVFHVRSWQKTTFFGGTEIHDEFTQLDFQATSGRVKIDRITGTRDYSSMAFIVWNLQTNDSDAEEITSRFKFVPAIYFENDMWVQIEDNAFLFADGTLAPPESLPVVAYDSN